MESTFIHRELLKKELRQLMPLIAGILSLCFLCYVLIEFQPARWRIDSFATGYVLLVMPSLFAVGAGAMSVSQEKETRTLGWLSSLPLSPRRLFVTKLVAALIAWLTLWVAVFLAFQLIELLRFNRPFPAYDLNNDPVRSYWILFWILHSLYLLICGFATSWKLESAMTALIAFIPLAVAPSFIRFGIAYALNPFHATSSSVYDATLPQSLAAVVIGLIIAGWLMRRFAWNALSPQSPPVIRNPYATGLRTLDASKQTSQSVLGPTSALLWQFIHQNKVVLYAIGVVTIICGVVLLFETRTLQNSQRRDWEPWIVFILLVCLSWMGVLAFQGDNLRERIRFLADRGVRPSRVWITRLLVPIAYASLLSWLYAILRNQYQAASPSETQIPVWMVFSFSILMVGYSHWVSQLVRNPILGAIAAPIIAAVVIAYTTYAAGALGTPIPYLIAIGTAPFVSTFAMMRRWIDRRFDWKFWGTHAALFTLVGIGPLVDFGWYVATFPDMPAEQKVSLRAEAASMRFTPVEVVISVALLENRSIFESDSEKPKLRLYDAMPWISEMVTSRMIEDENTDNPSNQLYQKYIKYLLELTKASRASLQLRMQEQADVLELALLYEILLPDAKERMTPALYQNAIKRFPSSKQRNESRRRAVVASWAEFDRKYEKDPMLDFGGFSLWYLSNRMDEIPMTKYSFTIRQRTNHCAGVLLQILELGNDAPQEQIEQLLLQRLINGGEPNDVMRGQIQYRVNDPRTDQIPFYLGELPGNQWLAGWEQIIDELASNIEAE